MSKINIRESLRNMDADSCCKYDLLTMYDACSLTDEDKADIAKLLFDNEDPEVIYQKLCNYFCDDDVSELTGLTDIQNVTPFEAIINNVKMGLDQKYDSVFYNDVAGQFEITSKDTTYTFGLSPVEYETDGISLYVDYNYDVPINYTSIKEASEDILTKCNEKVSTASQSNAVLDDDTMEYTVYDVVEDEGRLCAKCMNESTNSFEDIKLGKVNSDAVNELLNNILNNPNYKLTNDCRKKIADNSAPWGIVMSPGFDITASNALMSTGDFGGSVSFGESEELTFENGDRVTDGDRKGTVIDCDSIKVLVDWDYSDTDDIEWVMKEDLSFVNALKESEKEDLRDGNLTEKDLLDAGYKYVASNSPYNLYRKIISGKGDWYAVNYENNTVQHITYAQARGDEPIDDKTGIKRLSMELGKKLLPQNESLGDTDCTESVHLGDVVDWHGTPHVVVNNDEDEDLLTLRPRDKFKDSDFGDDDEGDNSEDVYISPLQLKESVDDGWVKRWSFEDMWYKGPFVISKNPEPYKGYHLEKVKPNGATAKHYGNFNSIDDAKAEASRYLKESDIVEEDAEGYVNLREAFEDTDELELKQAQQEFSSAATSINSNKLPAIYNMVEFRPGDVVVDFGGGKFDNAVNYLKDKNVTLLVYDPYNRSAEHNKEVLRLLKEHGGADAAVNSNVLNVIKEPEAREAVLKNIKKITRRGAPIYITVYEGRGDGVEGPTKSGYQLNRKTGDYMNEVGKVFSNVKRKGKLITAINESTSMKESIVTDASNIGQGYAAPIMVSLVTKAKELAKEYKNNKDKDGFERLLPIFEDNILDYKSEIEEKIKDFDKYWEVHKKAMLDNISEAVSILKNIGIPGLDSKLEKLNERYSIKDVKEFLDEIGGFTDYDGKIEELMDNFGMTKDEAESAIQCYVIEPDDDDDIQKIEESYSDDEWIDKMWEAFQGISGIEDISEGKKPNTYIVTFDSEGSATARARILLKALIKADLDIELDSSNGSNVFTFITPTNEWEFIKGKMVKDSDGFLTSYDWYRNTDSGLNIFMFGEEEADPDYADWETESDSEAEDWFKSYNGFNDEEELDESAGSSGTTEVISKELKDAAYKLFKTPKWGFESDKEIEDYINPIFDVSEDPKTGDIEVQVRAELGYNNLMDLSDVLDKVISKYDKDAYFEPEQPGILCAFIRY